MSKEITIFNNERFGEIRTAGTPEEPLFCLSDICKALELPQVSRVRSRLKKDGLILIKATDSLGRQQETLFCNEQNLYRVIMRSDKPNAESFQDWVCGEVLPAIRKTGKYELKKNTISLPDFSNPAEAARAWAEQYEQKMIEARRADEAEKQVLTLTKEIESAQPKITYYEAFMNSVHGSKASCIREVVKQAHIKSETEFIAWMLRKHILFRSGKGNRLQPYAEYTSYFDIIDVYDARNDWSGKQLKMNPYGKNKVVKRYHDEHPEAFYEQKQLFNI